MNWKQNWNIVDDSYKEGGQGKVVKVQSKSDSSIYGALKLMHPEQVKISSRKERLITEIKAVSIIDGNGVPKILEYFEGDDETPPYFIAEWKDGVTLDQFASKNRISIKESIEIIKVLASTIRFCHEKDIIHRDIKPQNIIIQSDERVPILVDFGISWVDSGIKKHSNKTPIGQELGNRFLRLPELTAGSENKHEKICDVTFIVGILFFLITKKSPRQLRDSKNLMPHERLNQKELESLESNELWEKVFRVFNIGFNQNEDLRFEDIHSFLTYIDSTFEEKKSEKMTLKEKLEERKRALTDILGNEKIEAKRKSIAEFKNINNAFAAKFRDEIEGNGFSSGTNNNITINFHKVNSFLRNDAVKRNSIRVSHEIRFSDDDSRIIASVEIESQTFDGRRMNNSIIKKEEYFKGYPTDLETLKESVNEKVQEFALIALDEFKKFI